jgi:branched-chain amino acid transport system permease protein
MKNWIIGIPLIITCFLFIGIPFFVGDAWISLLIEMFIMAIAAAAGNLMAGYAGMISFGLSGFYGTGAYATALLITKYNFPFSVAFICGPFFAAIISIPIGWFCVRRSAIYFAMLSLAFSQLLYSIAFTWYSFTGGDDGIVGIAIPTMLYNEKYYYYLTLIILVVSLITMWIIVNSPFGKTIQAIRDNPERVAFIGINIRQYQLSLYVISSFYLGLAGTLYAGFNQNVFADYLHWVKTFDIIIAYLLGGMFTFFGPVVGGMIYIYANKIISNYTEYWPFVLGVV